MTPHGECSTAITALHTRQHGESNAALERKKEKPFTRAKPASQPCRPYKERRRARGCPQPAMCCRCCITLPTAGPISPTSKHSGQCKARATTRSHSSGCQQVLCSYSKYLFIQSLLFSPAPQNGAKMGPGSASFPGALFRAQTLLQSLGGEERHSWSLSINSPVRAQIREHCGAPFFRRQAAPRSPDVGPGGGAAPQRAGRCGGSTRTAAPQSHGPGGLDGGKAVDGPRPASERAAACPRAPRPSPAPRLALSCDLETFPLRSRSSAVKACQMAFSSSSLRPTMAGRAADTPLLQSLTLGFSLPVARRRQARPAPPRGREPGPAATGASPRRGAARLPPPPLRGEGRLAPTCLLYPLAEQPNTKQRV